MRYLVTMNGHAPFYTNWFLAENHFIHGSGMVVYDLDKNVYTDDGENWKPIK